MEEEDGRNDDGGTYFIDQEGRYFYQATPDSKPVLTTAITSINGDEEITLGEETSQMLVDGTDGYQTVTIVPDRGGEVSYVLIVQADENAKGDNGAEEEDDAGKAGASTAIYDFEDDGEDGTKNPKQEALSDQEDDKSKIEKIIKPKKKGAREKHMCMYCNYTSPRKYLLSRHMKSHSQERPFKCSICERGFKTLSSLTNHINTHTGNKPYVCKHCMNPFTTSGELVRHVRYKHTHEKPHKCTECDYASVELSKLKRHIRCHTGERPYQCPHCTYASPDTFKLKRHLRTHTGEKPYKCDECNDAFSQSNSLKSHKLLHNIAEKPVFKCEWCPTTCGRKTDLRIHIQKLHTSDKPLKCRRCGKSFPDRYSYKLHNKTHEGERCYKCQLCPYASTNQRHLDRHMLVHTNEKPFSCDQCDQSFRQKQLLKRHQNLYHNPEYVRAPPREKHHECRECGRQFRHKGNLIRHMELHDPESGVHEKILALRLGRQKRIEKDQLKQQKESSESENDNEGDIIEEEQEMLLTDGQDNKIQAVAVEGEDGRQYVVLEVIQLQGLKGDQQVAVVTSDNYMQLEDQDVQLPPEVADSRVKAQAKSIKLEDDVTDFFGFDVDVDEEETIVSTKGSVSMIN